MADCYRWADVVVLPTISDTFGLAILEAMAFGVPVITTANSGGREVIRPGVDGWLVPIRDPQAIAEKLETLLKDVELRQHLSGNAESRVRQFSEQAYCQNLVASIAKAA